MKRNLIRLRTMLVSTVQLDLLAVEEDISVTLLGHNYIYTIYRLFVDTVTNKQSATVCLLTYAVTRTQTIRASRQYQQEYCKLR